ncbi:NAD-dependent epimerase/dehydratase family protein [Ramlibacter sp. G-1-2-2]|uniref:NAD-dependent epimerase/dehydratase family protein n=1 Tax=Ramlibacter agri TaxID=2728837 RepID=A0A848HF06_9BURK|nr:NAD-dependent epimerase/dehydratase family protein [Ramlibacter agri]NML47113.1 NAD-dependent epimerase/dehydratase family protein [Ramlibacter agri]
MHIVVTGANGFVGQALVASLREARSLAGQPITRLTALDTAFAGAAPAEFERQLAGSIANPASVATAFEPPVDVVFHLASIPGGTAEHNYELARDVNLGGTTLLLEAARAQALRGGRAPVFVFASTIGIFASPLPAQVDDDTPAGPGMSYGAQKLVGEILVSDFSRRGWVDGRSVRLPGVLARPPARTGQMSAFMSDMIRELGAGRPITLPVRPEASTWASSLPSIVDNLLHAASVPAERLGTRRSFTLPTLHFSFAQLVAAIGAVRGEDVSALATWQPEARIEALFGSFPPIVTPAADAAGFRNDGSLENLVRRATQFG